MTVTTCLLIVSHLATASMVDGLGAKGELIWRVYVPPRTRVVEPFAVRVKGIVSWKHDPRISIKYPASLHDLLAADALDPECLK